MRFVLVTLIATLPALPALAARGEGGGHRFPPFDSSTYASQLFWLVLTFGTLYALMSRVALPRIGSVLEARREMIEGSLRAASAAQKEAEEQAAALEASLTKARANAQAIAGEARDKSAKEIEAQRVSVEKDLAGKLAAAEARIAETKAKAMGNVEGIAKEAVAAIVEQLGGKATDAAVAKAISAAQG